MVLPNQQNLDENPIVIIENRHPSEPIDNHRTGQPIIERPTDPVNRQQPTEPIDNPITGQPIDLPFIPVGGGGGGGGNFPSPNPNQNPNHTTPPTSTSETCTKALVTCSVIIGALEGVASVAKGNPPTGDAVQELQTESTNIQQAQVLSTLGFCLSKQNACPVLSAALTTATNLRANTPNLPYRPGTVLPLDQNLNSSPPTKQPTPLSTTNVLYPTKTPPITTSLSTTTSTSISNPSLKSLEKQVETCGAQLGQCGVKRIGIKNLKKISSSQLGKTFKNCLDTNSSVQKSCPVIEDIEQDIINGQ